MDNLLRQLELRAIRSRMLARRNYFVAYSLFVTALAASVVGTIINALNTTPPCVRAAIAAIPAGVVLANSTLKLPDRAALYWRRAQKLDALMMKVRYMALDLPSAATEFNEIEKSFEDAWPQFAPLPSAPKTP